MIVNVEDNFIIVDIFVLSFGEYKLDILYNYNYVIGGVCFYDWNVIIN